MAMTTVFYTAGAVGGSLAAVVVCKWGAAKQWLLRLSRNRLVAPVVTLARTLVFYSCVGTMLMASFFVCAVARVLSGDIVAKRWHERILGRWLVNSIQFLGMTRLKITGSVPPTNTREGALNGTNEVFVIVPNHSSWMDHAYMSFVPIDKKYLTNAKYYTLPFFGWTQWVVKDVGVNLSSDKARHQSIETCQAVLAQKRTSIVIYPEGTRQRSPPTLLPFKRGAFLIAFRAGVRILPVALKNVHGVLPRGGWPGVGDTEIVIGEPMEFGKITRGKTEEDVIQEMIARVTTWMDQQLSKPPATN